MNEKRKCPLCGRATQEPFKPFCSKRCSELDLGRWLKGAYAIPAVEENDEDESKDATGKEDGEA